MKRRSPDHYDPGFFFFVLKIPAWAFFPGGKALDV
jgi:hypothetical protein